MPTKSPVVRLLPFLVLFALLACLAYMALYPIGALNIARRNGVYPTPQDHVYALASRYYCGVEKVVIERAGPNAFDNSNPHIWYVIYKIYAKHHAPCDPDHPGSPLYHQTYDSGGHYYLNTLDGWVMMPEGAFPDYIGAWMKVFHQAGPGNPTRYR